MSAGLTEEARRKDYSLVGKDSQLAIERGLAGADWYTSPVPKDKLRELLTRKDGPPIRDCLIYFGLILASGYATFALWGSWWALVPMMIYGILYASASDARWHESSHGTAFKTDWLNNLLYEVASFMVLRESIPWRWSHTRHHSDTIIVGRDPEIAVPRPPDLKSMLLKCVNFQAFRRYVTNICLHCGGKVNAEEATFIPASEQPKVFLRARIYAVIFLAMFALCIYYRTWLPFVFVLGPNLYGAWLMPIYGWTQHAGLAENVLDHRLNCRTIKMNFVHRFLYWNMNFHLEHHMFPLVPYHQLPKLHKIVKNDCPEPYPSLTAAYREIIPTVLRQIKDPGYFIKRKLPPGARPVGTKPTPPALSAQGRATADGWITVCASDLLDRSDVIRFDHDQHTYAVYRTDADTYHATDGVCTHGNTHLADGLVKGKIIEFPKHNGRFDITDGSPQRPPVCVALRTYPVKVVDGQILLNPAAPGGRGLKEKTYTFKVVSNRNVATFIKELVLEPAAASDFPAYQPGQYMQLNIPAYREIRFGDFEVAEPYASVWKAHHVFDFKAANPLEVRRNYSLATRPGSPDRQLRFNVRIATPPRGQDCDAGVGSSYVYSLKPGDTVTGIGPFGDFLIRDSDREMVYLGGGAGMAPLRSHLSHLFETLQTGRRVTFWYGARSKQEIFYEDYFRGLEALFPNFRFHIALSEPLPEDRWTGHTGFIHEVLKREHLDRHPNPRAIEYYLCGPPLMIQAAQNMLRNDFDIAAKDIAFDEF
jgi:Na(+)-translocating NADH:ubiquinone oxidoreductase F subunit